MQIEQCFPTGAWLSLFNRMRWIAILAAVAVVPWSTPVASARAADNEEIPNPEDLVLQTGDGLLLTLTYYPGLKGKQTIPIVLLHGWKQSRNEYKDLAPALQKFGYAVVVPDLRGHGQSKRLKGARRNEILDAAKMALPQFGLMVVEDMKAVKNFLWEKNNAGELNINKLCVVGSEMGASVALDFAWYDALGYDYNTPYYGSLQLGRFVKAVVLISPEWSFRGLPLRRAVSHPTVQQNISILILVGRQNAKSMAAAKRIYGVFDKFHPEPTGDDKLDHQTLFLGKLNTSLQGTKLLDPKFRVKDLIADFVYRRLVRSDEAREWTWKERKFPHE